MTTWPCSSAVETASWSYVALKITRLQECNGRLIALLITAPRFFAFAHAELPIIIRRAIEEAEEEEEVEDDEDAMEQEEEEPVLSLAQASFSVWLCACFIFTQNLHALFFVQNIGI